MKASLAFLAPPLFAGLAGCSETTPIRDVRLPPVTVIEGTVTDVRPSGFTLTGASATIAVRADLAGGQPLALAPNERVTVYGNLEGGQQRVFDAYVVKTAAGRQIIVNQPGGHLGFVLQTAF